ncbi:unnamed protein product [Symbiodinium natans]|uniref:Uncharacterized protein n=1 Tax=Symbiodinium natans TaxID=878477 RepID=A0A812LRA9_9DINO|nr:unnamed protein product [Symbiodinium natans]
METARPARSPRLHTLAAAKSPFDQGPKAVSLDPLLNDQLSSMGQEISHLLLRAGPAKDFELLESPGREPAPPPQRRLFLPFSSPPPETQQPKVAMFRSGPESKVHAPPVPAQAYAATKGAALVQPAMCSRCPVLNLQVRALSQSLAGLGAKTFNWSSGLSKLQRRDLAEVVLEYCRPCAHLDPTLEDLCIDLEQIQWAEVSGSPAAVGREAPPPAWLTKAPDSAEEPLRRPVMASQRVDRRRHSSPSSPPLAAPAGESSEAQGEVPCDAEMGRAQRKRSPSPPPALSPAVHSAKALPQDAQSLRLPPDEDAIPSSRHMIGYKRCYNSGCSRSCNEDSRSAWTWRSSRSFSSFSRALGSARTRRRRLRPFSRHAGRSSRRVPRRRPRDRSLHRHARSRPPRPDRPPRRRRPITRGFHCWCPGSRTCRQDTPRTCRAQCLLRLLMGRRGSDRPPHRPSDLRHPQHLRGLLGARRRSAWTD